jgi:hypothetical protein
MKIKIYNIKIFVYIIMSEYEGDTDSEATVSTVLDEELEELTSQAPTEIDEFEVEEQSVQPAQTVQPNNQLVRQNAIDQRFNETGGRRRKRKTMRRKRKTLRRKSAKRKHSRRKTSKRMYTNKKRRTKRHH